MVTTNNIDNTINHLDLFQRRTIAYKEITLAEFTVNQDDLDIENGCLFRISADAPRDLTGLTRGFQGREVVLLNVGAQDITIKNNDAGSAEANRILTGIGTDVVIGGSGGMLRLIYDTGASRWRSTAKEAAPGPGPGSFVDTINSVQEDGAGNIDLVAATGYDIKFTGGTNEVIIETPDWHSFNFGPANVGATSFKVFGTLVIPAGKAVTKVQLGARRSDDTADAQIEASVKNETSTNEVTSSAEYPDDAALAGAATERLIVSVKNGSGTPRDVFASVRILLENV